MDHKVQNLLDSMYMKANWFILLRFIGIEESKKNEGLCKQVRPSFEEDMLAARICRMSLGKCASNVVIHLDLIYQCSHFSSAHSKFDLFPSTMKQWIRRNKKGSPQVSTSKSSTQLHSSISKPMISPAINFCS